VCTHTKTARPLRSAVAVLHRRVGGGDVGVNFIGSQWEQLLIEKLNLYVCCIAEHFIEWFLFPVCLFLILISYVQRELNLAKCVVATPETRSRVNEV
jgi:hypothetical protein